MSGPFSEAMAGRGLVVEFVGMPGSGKSTLSRRAAELLEARGLKVTQPSYPLAHGIPRAARLALKSRLVALELLAHPLRSLRAVRAIQASGQGRPADAGRMTFNWLLVTRLMSHPPASGDLHFYDQGILQALWSIAYGGAPGAAARAAARLEEGLPRPDAVVVVRASEDTVRRRLDSRLDRDSRLDDTGPDGGLAIARGARVFEEVMAVLSGWGRRSVPPRVLETPNNADDLETAAVTLAGRLQLLITGR